MLSRSLVRLSAAVGAFVANTTYLLAQNIPTDDLNAIPVGPDPNIDPKDLIVRVLLFVLDFVSLIAIIFIVIAGIRLIVSQGSEEQKNKAKKTIVYVIVGLLVILFARVIVSFVTGLSGLI
jgi:hypothetical protein